jgi:hypothetical protein
VSGGARRLGWDDFAPADLFDHLHPEEPVMSNQPRPGNPARAVRVEDELWNEAKAIAAKRGDSLSDVMRQALERYVKRHRQAE